MRFMKSAMAIMAVCAAMMTMVGMRRRKMNREEMQMRRGMMRHRHG